MHNILFVDDELIYKLTIQNLVDWEKHGFSIIGTASNGEEALEFFKNKPVHAVITDLQMPIMDGITLIQELRKYGFAGPILALSNYSDYEYVRGALIAGAYDYLIKINITKEQVEKSLHKCPKCLPAVRNYKVQILDCKKNLHLTKKASDYIRTLLIQNKLPLLSNSLCFQKSFLSHCWLFRSI